MAGGGRALLIYDEACEFCRLWIAHWRSRTGDRVHYATVQEIASKFPEVPPEKYARAVQMIDEDGTRHEGAAAIFRLVSKCPGRKWVKKVQAFPGVAAVSERAYRFVAKRRPFFLKLSRLLWGESIATPRYGLVTRLFLQALALIYFFAFLSLAFHLPGLAGEDGILPADAYLQALSVQHGSAAAWLAPTPAWLGAHAGALQASALLGALAALLAFGGVLIVPLFLLMWVLYVSLATAGQGFTAFPEDLLLLEAGFLAIFLTPFQRTASFSPRLAASGAVVWLYRFLLFRIFFSSALAQLLSGSPAQGMLSAAANFFASQPSPTPVAWLAHQLPTPVLKLGAAAALGLQLAIAFFCLLPRRARWWGAALAAGLQVAAMLAGASMMWSALVLACCLLLIDDAWLERLRARLKFRALKEAPERESPRRRFVMGVAAVLVVLGWTQLVGSFARLPLPTLLLTTLLEPFRISNAYAFLLPPAGLRSEIVIEGSADGLEWKEYEFKQKPGGVKHLAGLNFAPPRLGQGLSIAAAEGIEAHPWTTVLMARLLQGSKSVLALVETNPFPDAPPRYIRAALYAYRFTSAEERRRDGSWWRRERKAEYAPPLSLESAVPAGKP